MAPVRGPRGRDHLAFLSGREREEGGRVGGEKAVVRVLAAFGQPKHGR